MVQVGRDALGHGPVVEAVPLPRRDDHLGCGLVNTEADLPVSIDVDDRVLNCAEP